MSCPCVFCNHSWWTWAHAGLHPGRLSSTCPSTMMFSWRSRRTPGSPAWRGRAFQRIQRCRKHRQENKTTQTQRKCSTLSYIDVWTQSSLTGIFVFFLLQELFRKVRSILNKLTPQKFNQLMKQVTDLTIDTEERLKGVIDLVFEKAIDEPSFSVAYGQMCRCLATVSNAFNQLA